MGDKNKATTDVNAFNDGNTDFYLSDANNIVPIKTEESINKRLLKMTGDKKRYGGGPGRVVKKGYA
jgi:hypothetical protein